MPWWQLMRVTLWVLLAFFLLALALLYGVVQAIQTQGLLMLVKLILMVAVLFVIFVVEGSEISVAGLHDKDPEQIADPRVRTALTLIQTNPERFIAGRQLFAVGSIVVLTLLSESLTSFDGVAGDSSVLKGLTSEKVKHVFVLAFPTFVVLWFSQLLPKFLAQEYPLAMLSWPITRVFVRIAISLGRVDLEMPSQHAKELLKRWMPGLLHEDKLLPSRAAHYKTSATLRHGQGLEFADVRIIIGAAGEVDVAAESWYESFGLGFKSVSGHHRWDGPIQEHSWLFTPIRMPERCGDPTTSGPTYSSANCNVQWEISFQNLIPAGEKLRYQIQYSTGAGACKSGTGDADFYTYVVEDATARVVVAVVPAANAPFVLTNGRCETRMSGKLTSPASALDEAETDRVRMTASDRGYRFEVAYPLEGSQFTFSWTVGRRLWS